MAFRARSLPFALSCFALSAGLSFAACDSGTSGDPGGGQTSTGTTGDGKYHPEPNGTHIGEQVACETLTKKQASTLLALGCVGTGQTCPSFLRSQFKTACMEYDQGSVNGCVAYYEQQTTCATLKNAFDTCSITPYPGTEPNGCPPLPDGGTGGTGGTGGSTTSTGGTGGTGGVSTSGSGGLGGTGGLASGSSSSGM